MSDKSRVDNTESMLRESANLRASAAAYQLLAMSGLDSSDSEEDSSSRSMQEDCGISAVRKSERDMDGRFQQQEGRRRCLPPPEAAAKEEHRAAATSILTPHDAQLPITAPRGHPPQRQPQQRQFILAPEAGHRPTHSGAWPGKAATAANLDLNLSASSVRTASPVPSVDTSMTSTSACTPGFNAGAAASPPHGSTTDYPFARRCRREGEGAMTPGVGAYWLDTSSGYPSASVSFSSSLRRPSGPSVGSSEGTSCSDKLAFHLARPRGGDAPAVFTSRRACRCGCDFAQRHRSCTRAALDVQALEREGTALRELLSAMEDATAEREHRRREYAARVAWRSTTYSNELMCSHIEIEGNETLLATSGPKVELLARAAARAAAQNGLFQVEALRAELNEAGRLRLSASEKVAAAESAIAPSSPSSSCPSSSPSLSSTAQILAGRLRGYNNYAEAPFDRRSQLAPAHGSIGGYMTPTPPDGNENAERFLDASSQRHKGNNSWIGGDVDDVEDQATARTKAELAAQDAEIAMLLKSLTSARDLGERECMQAATLRHVENEAIAAEVTAKTVFEQQIIEDAAKATAMVRVRETQLELALAESRADIAELKDALTLRQRVIVELRADRRFADEVEAVAMARERAEEGSVELVELASMSQERQAELEFDLTNSRGTSSELKDALLMERQKVTDEVRALEAAAAEHGSSTLDEKRIVEESIESGAAARMCEAQISQYLADSRAQAAELTDALFITKQKAAHESRARETMATRMRIAEGIGESSRKQVAEAQSRELQLEADITKSRCEAAELRESLSLAQRKVEAASSARACEAQLEADIANSRASTAELRESLFRTEQKAGAVVATQTREAELKQHIADSRASAADLQDALFLMRREVVAESRAAQAARARSQVVEQATSVGTEVMACQMARPEERTRVAKELYGVRGQLQDLDATNNAIGRRNKLFKMELASERDADSANDCRASAAERRRHNRFKCAAAIIGGLAPTDTVLLPIEARPGKTKAIALPIVDVAAAGPLAQDELSSVWDGPSNCDRSDCDVLAAPAPSRDELIASRRLFMRQRGAFMKRGF